MIKEDFYKHDSYLIIRQKFTNAWTNLRLEMNRQSIVFYKEGRDEFDDSIHFFPAETANELLFTMTGAMAKAAAEKLFAKHYAAPIDGSSVQIFGNCPGEVIYLLDTAALDECNQPFILPLNQFRYAEFQQRFAERWPNLSIEIYQGKTENDNLQELAANFEMNMLDRVNRLTGSDYYERNGFRDVVVKCINEHALHDGTYLSDLANSLGKTGISFRIRNNRLGIYWDRNLEQHRLHDFQEAADA